MKEPSTRPFFPGRMGSEVRGGAEGRGSVPKVPPSSPDSTPSSGGERPKKRPLSVVILSDLHLGTVGCHADALLHYLRSVNPRILVLNGDIIDCWHFTRLYWPASHLKVIQRIVKMASLGTEVYYVTGNHDELLRKFAEQHLGHLHLVNKVVLALDGRRTWIFHGDVFDVVQKYSRWLARLGSVGYDLLILINRLANWISLSLGRERISLSKKIKDGVKRAVRYVSDFERTAVELAVEHGFDAVACGHIHQPALRRITTSKGEVLYLNSGDWIENLTALEYEGGGWRLFQYRDHEAELSGASSLWEEAAEEEGVDLRAGARLVLAGLS